MTQYPSVIGRKQTHIKRFLLHRPQADERERTEWYGVHEETKVVKPPAPLVAVPAASVTQDTLTTSVEFSAHTRDPSISPREKLSHRSLRG